MSRFVSLTMIHVANDGVAYENHSVQVQQAHHDACMDNHSLLFLLPELPNLKRVPEKIISELTWQGWVMNIFLIPSFLKFPTDVWIWCGHFSP